MSSAHLCIGTSLSVFDSIHQHKDSPTSPLISPFQYNQMSRRSPLYSLFGTGKAAEIILWKDTKVSAAAMVGFTLIWVVFEVAEVHLVPLLCYFVITIMILLLLWSLSKQYGLIQRGPPSIQDLKFQDSTFRFLQAKLNRFLHSFYDLSTGKDIKLFLLTLLSLWLVSIVGNNFSSLSFLYFVFICLETIPVLYQKYQGEVNYFASKGSQEMKNSFHKLYSTLSTNIPSKQKRLE